MNDLVFSFCVKLGVALSPAFFLGLGMLSTR